MNFTKKKYSIQCIKTNKNIIQNAVKISKLAIVVHYEHNRADVISNKPKTVKFKNITALQNYIFSQIRMFFSVKLTQVDCCYYVFYPKV